MMTNPNREWQNKIDECNTEYLRLEKKSAEQYVETVHALEEVLKIAQNNLVNPIPQGYLLNVIMHDRIQFIVLRDENNSNILTLNDERGQYVPVFTSTDRLVQYEDRCPSGCYPSRGEYPEPFMIAGQKRIRMIIDPFDEHAMKLDADLIRGIEWYKLPSNHISTDYNKRCGNCHAEFLNHNEKYCTFCGTKRGEGRFEPYDNRSYCVYGPMPEKRTRECLKCGNQWTYTGMLDRQKFCAKCGAPSKLLQSTFNRLRFVDTGVLYTPSLVHINAKKAPCCNRLIPANYKFCPFCGKKVSKAVEPELDPIVVDMEERKWSCKCGQASPMRYRYCGLCGKDHG